MSNNLDDSIGSELVADDEKSIHERMNNNSINTYTVKMKTDIQNRQNNIPNNYFETQQFSQSLNTKNLGIFLLKK